MATTQRRGKQQATTKRTQAHGLMKAVQPSAELAAIVGPHRCHAPRSPNAFGIILKAWSADAKNRRMINADAKLRPVVGGQEQISMFDLPKLVSHHVQ
jgi:chromatin remodeling complex protein RSC6